MKSLYIAMRIFNEEKGRVLLFSIAFFIPLVLSIFGRGGLIENFSVFLLFFPLLFYPFFFFLRGISLTRKEWTSKTVYIYKTNPVKAVEYEAGYLFYFVFEVLYFTTVPLVLIHNLSHSFKTIIVFSMSTGTVFVPFPLFLLSCLYGRSLYLLTRSIYQKRNTLAFFTGIAGVALFLKLYGLFKGIFPSPFKLELITDSSHIYKIGGFSFMYSFIWLLVVFAVNLYLWKVAEG